MERSIETIWREGFLKSDTLVAPKVNSLYNQKSKHIIDKFKRMFRMNLILLVVGSVLFLGVSFVMGIPVMGIGLFIVLSIIVVVNKKLAKGLDKINKADNSYNYIKSFDSWMKAQKNVNRKMARYYYPLIFLAVVLGVWFSDNFQNIFNRILQGSNEIYFINGIPVFWVMGVIAIMMLLAVFGGRLYDLDVNIVYGRVFKKLDELISDMEELKA